MKIVFFGTSEFAVPSLKELSASAHEILAVVTQPDRKKGRHLHKAAPPIKIEAASSGISVHQPENPNAKDFIKILSSIKADLFVVVSFGHILKKDILDMPRLGAVNLHASLLPKYRGAAPINWAVIKGEKDTGVSIIKMTEKMDAGDIVASEKIKILPEDTAATLTGKLSNKGALLLLKALDETVKGKTACKKQDEKLVSFAPKLKKENGLIDWSWTAPELHNLIRGLLPWPGAYTHWKGRLLKIWKAEAEALDFDLPPGRISTVGDKGIVVKTSSGSLVINELQLEGGKRMDAAAFIRGHKLSTGDKLG